MPAPKSTGHLHLSTAEKEHAKACDALYAAEDAEWDNPTDPNAQRRVKFWTAETARLAALPADTVIPLF